MKSTRGIAAAALAAAVAVVGLSAPASADPGSHRGGGYLQPDVPRSLDVGLLPATGDKRFVRSKARPGVPARDKSGRTLVYVEGTSAAAAVKAAGGQVLQTDGNRVRAAVAGDRLITLARAQGVAEVRQPDRAFPLAVTSEGVEASGAGAWIRAGKTGAGVKVGIVDVGFDGLADAQAAGEIPAGATLHGDNCPADGAEQHGTAVAEVVHDEAPGADLYLACAPDSMTFASAVQWLTSQHVQIITAAIGFPNTGRGDGTGPDGSPAAVVQQARQAGILWVAAAGNQAQLHWSGPATDANSDGYVEVNGTAEGNGVTVPSGGTATVSLRWDGWPTTRQDLDLMVLSSNHVPTGPGDPAIVAESTNPQATAASPLPPTEQVTIENTSGGSQAYWTYVAARTSYPATRADLFVLGDATSLSYPVAAGSVLEPATSPYAMAVGASSIGSGRVDAYSSQGPTIDGRTKPDIVGQSGVSTFTYGPAPTMAGTSAAAAHVAGAAALLEGANGDLDAGQVEAMLEGRTSPSKFDNQWGHGLLALGSTDATQPNPASGFTPLQEPQRLIDTSTSTSLHPGNFGAGEVYTLPVAGLPTDATAVAVNLTAWSANRTHVDLYRDVDSYGGVSTVELQPNEKRTSMAIVPLSAARTIAIRNDAGAAGLNIDLLGYFSPSGSGTYFPADAPQRVLDTHSTIGGHNAPLAAGETYALPVRGVAGVPSNATAVLVDVGLTEASATTFLQVFPQVSPSHNGTVETDPNGVRSNLALTGIGDDGAIRIHNQAGTASVTVDLLGWFAPGAGAKYVPLPRATKVLDTRTGTGGPIGPIGQAASVPLSVSDVAGVPRDIAAPVLAVAAGGDGNGSLSAGPAERGWSGLADLQGLQPGKTVAGTIVPRAGDSGTIRIRNEAGSTDLTAAVTGYFVGGAPLAAPTGSCTRDAEDGFTPIFDGRSPQSSEWRQAGTAGPVNSANCELSSTPNDSFLWYSAEDLPSDYTLRLDYKTASDSSDSGILLGFGAPASGSVAAAGGKEVQIKPNGSATVASGAIYGSQEPSAQAEKPAGEWNAAEITVSGKRITVKINDVEVNDVVVTTAGQLKDPAYIGLQGSAAGDLVTFRDVRVRADKPSARYGTITGNGGLCVDVLNAARASATALQTIACRAADDAQFFTLPGDGTLRIYGLCVDATGPARTGTYLNVQTYTCNGASSQQWVPRADGTLYSAVRNACLDAPQTGVLHLYTFTCTGTSNQQWHTPTAQARFGPVLAFAYPDLCIDVVNQQAVVGASVQDVLCKDDIGSQQWTMPGDGTLRIYGYCLDENGPIRASSDRWLQLTACNGSATEQWAVRPGEAIYNPATNRCVDAFHVAATTGGRLEAYPCNVQTNQRYSIPALGLGSGIRRSTAAQLEASYSMNENNGSTTADDTAGARTQTLTGGPAWATGHEGASLSFNGISAYTTTPRTTLQTDRSYSISAWAMVTSSPAGSSRAIVAQDATGRTPFTLMSYAAGNEWEFAVTQTSASTAYTRIGAGSGSLVLNRWTHLVGVYDADAGQARLYVDGVLKNTVHVEGLWLAPGATVIGRTWWSGEQDDFFAGQIDDVRLYQGVLTQDQITALSRS